MVLLPFVATARLELFFGTANECGAMLASGAVVLLALDSGASRARPWAWRAACLAAAALLVVGVGLSGSRSAAGGLLLGAGVVVLMRRRTSAAFAAAALALVVAATIAATPAGARFAAAFRPADDASITHRLAVWRHTLALIGDHGVTGVGRARFAATYSGWYAPLDRWERYGSGLSDPLSLAAWFGLPVLWLLLSAAGVVFGLCSYVSVAQDDTVAAAATGAMVALIPTSLTSTLTLHWPTWCLAGAVTMTAAWVARRRAVPWRRATGVALGMAAIAATAVVVLGAAAQRSADSLGFHVVETVDRETLGVPRHREPLGLVVILSDDPTLVHPIRMYARPLCARGYAVACVVATGFSGTRVELGQQLGRLRARVGVGGRLPLFILSVGEASRAVLAAERPEQPAVSAAVLVSPSVDPVPAGQLGKTVPLAVVRATSDPMETAETFGPWFEALRAANPRVRAVAIRSSNHLLYDNNDDLIAALVDYFAHLQT